MDRLGALSCGQPVGVGAAAVALGQIRSSIEALSARCLAFVDAPFTIETRLFGLFCARTLLETCCAALAGRIDPVRLLYLCTFQKQIEYDVKKPIRTAFNWTGDVVSRLPPNPKLWNTEYDFDKISRALLSQYLDILIWRPGIEDALDFVHQSNTGPGLDEFKRLEPESFVDVTKGRFVQLYSTLSKGVHWEFFDILAGLDEDTIKSAIRDVMITVSRLAFVSHFIPTAHANLTAPEALAVFVHCHGRLS